MTPNDAPPLSDDEIAEIRRVLGNGYWSKEPRDEVYARFDRLVAERDALRAFKSAFPPVPDGEIARRMVEDRAVAENASLKAELTNWRVTAARGHAEPCNLGPLCPYCEIDKLKAEVDSLERSNSQLRWMVEETIREHAPDRAEVERLRKEFADAADGQVRKYVPVETERPCIQREPDGE